MQFFFVRYGDIRRDLKYTVRQVWNGSRNMQEENMQDNNMYEVYDDYSSEAGLQKAQESRLKSNVLSGVTGALAGAHIGFVIWMALVSIGWTAGIPAVATAFLICLLYDYLGGCMDRKGCIICVVMVFIYALLWEYLSYAHAIFIVYREYYPVSYINAVITVPELLVSDSATTLGIIVEAVMVVVFSMAAAIITITWRRGKVKKLS